MCRACRYSNLWDGRLLRCALLPSYGSSRVCYLKAAATDSWSVATGTNQTLAEAVLALARDRQLIGARDSIVLNAGLHPGLDLPSVLADTGHALQHLRSHNHLTPRVIWRETGPIGCALEEQVPHARGVKFGLSPPRSPWAWRAWRRVHAMLVRD